MNSLINFFLETFICFLLFYLIYYLFLRNEACFTYNRLYLLATAGLSLVLPLINIELITSSRTLQSITLEQVIYLPEITVTQTGVPKENVQKSISWTQIISWVYAGGVLLLLIRLLTELFHIFKLYYRSKKQNSVSGNVVLTNGQSPTFSFLNLIFLDNISLKTELEKQQVLTHEKAHIRHRHTWDMLFFELLAVFLWFNPVIRWYKKSMEEVHEYVADRDALTENNKDAYVKTLASQGLQQMGIHLVQPFNASHLLKRIHMMDKYNQPTSLLKMLMVIPVIAAAFLVFSCSDEINHAVAPPVAQSLPATWQLVPEPDLNQVWQHRIKKLSDLYPGHEFFAIRYTDTQAVTYQLNEDWQIVYIDHQDPQTAIAEYAADRNFTEMNEVFTIVEQQPVPEGGMQNMYNHIARHLSYPAQAKEMGIEGKVFVQFIVDVDGSVKEATPIKGIGAGCDQAAVEVIQSLPPWKPGLQKGRPVKVKMILPITFKLN